MFKMLSAGSTCSFAAFKSITMASVVTLCFAGESLAMDVETGNCGSSAAKKSAASADSSRGGGTVLDTSVHTRETDQEQITSTHTGTTVITTTSDEQNIGAGAYVVVLYTAKTAPLLDGPGTNKAFVAIRTFLRPLVLDEAGRPLPDLEPGSSLVSAYNAMYSVFRFLKNQQREIDAAEERERDLQSRLTAALDQSALIARLQQELDQARQPQIQINTEERDLEAAQVTEATHLLQAPEPEPQPRPWRWWYWFKFWNLRIVYR